MSETRVRIVQALCPLRHCIMASPYQSDDENTATCEELLREKLTGFIAAGMINPRCAICAAPPEQWIYEDRPTIFRTMEEAEPFLRALETAQARARAALSANKN